MTCTFINAAHLSCDACLTPRTRATAAAASAVDNAKPYPKAPNPRILQELSVNRAGVEAERSAAKSIALQASRARCRQVQLAAVKPSAQAKPSQVHSSPPSRALCSQAQRFPAKPSHAKCSAANKAERSQAKPSQIECAANQAELSLAKRGQAECFSAKSSSLQREPSRLQPSEVLFSQPSRAFRSQAKPMRFLATQAKCCAVQPSACQPTSRALLQLSQVLSTSVL